MERIGMKRNKLFVAVTGGIGSGKSTVMQILSKSGYATFSADTVARDIYNNENVFTEIERLFPECVSDDCEIDRKKLADIVFSDPNKVKILNSVTHPMVMQILFNQMNACDQQIVFAEVPLLFEGGFEKDFDVVIVVMRDEQLRIKSAAERDGVSEEKIIKRIKNQFNYEKNTISEHTVLYNDGSIELLKKKVLEIVEKIIFTKTY